VRRDKAGLFAYDIIDMDMNGAIHGDVFHADEPVTVLLE
jgi:hypothetical protein